MTDPHSTPRFATAYADGRIAPLHAAALPADDHGVLFGIGFYETFRTSGGRPHLWPWHRRRLEQACGVVGIHLGPDSLFLDEPRLNAVVAELLRREEVGDAVFRYTVTAGPAAAIGTGQAGEVAGRISYTRPRELLTMRALPPEPAPAGICLRVLGVSRDNGEWIPRPKSIGCANAMLGAAELQRRSAAVTDEGLFLSREGEFVVETVRQNVAWIRDGQLCYPDPTVGAIAGTALAWVNSLGAPSRPCRARLDELIAADAVVVMNSVRGITPVAEIRDRHDRVLVTALPSHTHPLVASLRRQWYEVLEATARGA